MTTLIISTVSLCVMIFYLVFLIGTWKISSKNSKRKMIYCLTLIGMCFITSMAYFFEGKNGTAILWLINVALWILNYTIAQKGYEQALEYEKRKKIN